MMNLREFYKIYFGHIYPHSHRSSQSHCPPHPPNFASSFLFLCFIKSIKSNLYILILLGIVSSLELGRHTRGHIFKENRLLISKKLSVVSISSASHGTSGPIPTPRVFNFLSVSVDASHQKCFTYSLTFSPVHSRSIFYLPIYLLHVQPYF